MWALNWKDVQYEFVPTMPGSSKPGGSKSAKFRGISPAGLVPALRTDENKNIFESNAILVYLAEKFEWIDLVCIIHYTG